MTVSEQRNHNNEEGFVRSGDLEEILTALTAIVVYVAGRSASDVDTAVLDRIYTAPLVYVGAQGIADNGKRAAQVAAGAAVASAGPSPITVAPSR